MDGCKSTAIATIGLVFALTIPAAVAQWEPEHRLTINTTESQTSINFAGNVAADERGRVHLVWFEEGNATRNIYYKRSTDFGVSWSADTRLTFDPAPSVRPSIAVQGSSLTVAWWDERDGNDEIYTKQSSDWGATWGSDVRLTNDPASSKFVTIAAAESGVHAVWQDQREGNLEIFYARAPGTLAEVGNGLIAFSKQGTSGLPQIYTIQPDGTDERQLASLGTNMLPA